MYHLPLFCLCLFKECLYIIIANFLCVCCIVYNHALYITFMNVLFALFK